MQKLSVELKNTPRDVKSLLVPCSVNSELNKDESLSVQSRKEIFELADNNPEGVLPQHTEGSLKPLVYVLSKSGLPLMPTTCKKAKNMLKKGVAKVIRTFPFYHFHGFSWSFI